MRRGTPAGLLSGLLVGLLAGLSLAGCTAGSDDRPVPVVTSSDELAEESRPEGTRLDQIRRAAASAVEVVLSYDHRTLDVDQETATALMTPEYADDFRASFSRLRTEATRVQRSNRAVALDSGVVSASVDTVRVLVFVDQTMRTAEGQPSLARIAPVVSMERSGGAWRVADIATGAVSDGEPTPLESAVTDHAARTAQAYLTLSWETIEQDLGAVQELVSGPLAQQYADGADELVEAVRARRTVQRPRILAVGSSSVGPATAEVLVSAVVTTTHQAAGGQPTQEGRRLRITLQREATGWQATRLAVVD